MSKIKPLLFSCTIAVLLASRGQAMLDMLQTNQRILANLCEKKLSPRPSGSLATPAEKYIEFLLKAYGTKNDETTIKQAWETFTKGKDDKSLTGNIDRAIEALSKRAQPDPQGLPCAKIKPNKVSAPQPSTTPPSTPTRPKLAIPSKAPPSPPSQPSKAAPQQQAPKPPQATPSSPTRTKLAIPSKPPPKPPTETKDYGCSVSKNSLPQILAMKKIAFNSNTPLKEQFRALVKGAVQNENLKQDVLDGFVAIFDEMVQREGARCNNDAVLYFGAGFAGIVVNAIRQLILGKETKSATELFNATIPSVADKAHADRDPKIRSNLMSASTSLTSLAPSESASDFFLTAKNINLNLSNLNSIITDIMKGYSVQKIKEVQGLVARYMDKFSRALFQVFIKKDSLKDLVYFSKPFGYPIDVDTKTVIEALSKGPDSFKQLITKDAPIGRKMNVYAVSYGAKIDTPQYFDYLQVRILATSHLLGDKSKVTTFINFLPTEREAANTFITELKTLF